MAEHKPATRDWVSGYVANEVSRLPEALLRRWDEYACDPWEGHLTRRPGASDQLVFVVAEGGRDVLYWDDIEKEFGRGKRVAAKWIESFGLVGERLTWALNEFHPTDGGG